MPCERLSASEWWVVVSAPDVALDLRIRAKRMLASIFGMYFMLKVGSAGIFLNGMDLF